MKKEEILQEVYNKIEDVLGSCTEKKVLNKNTVILDCGLDSLGYALIMLRLEECTGKSVIEDDIDWANIKTIDQLISLFI